MATELDDIELRPARRRFIQGAAGLAAVTIAPGLLLYQVGQAAGLEKLEKIIRKMKKLKIYFLN